MALYEYVCENPECSEFGVTGRMSNTLYEPGVIVCGALRATDPPRPCGEPMVSDEVEYPDPTPLPTIEERVTALEQFNAQLITVLAAHDIIVGDAP